MKIAFLTTGPYNTASSRTRVYYFFPYLQSRGIKIYTIPYTSKGRAYKLANGIRVGLPDKIIDRFFAVINMLRFIFLSRKCEILFIQKIVLPRIILRLIKAFNDTVIFDFDDAIFMGRFSKGFTYMVKNCKSVIAGNEFLVNKAASINKRTYMLNTPVETKRFFPKAKAREIKKEVTVGWIGSPDSCGYLRPLRPVFEILLKKYDNLKFEFIGGNNFFKDLNRCVIKTWGFDSEVSDLQNLDIGIMPLEDDEWCRGKCGYKILQYMAVGIPCVASPVGINRSFVRDGVSGYLADSESEWVQKLSILIADSQLRFRMGEAARKIAEEFYSYDIAAPKLVNIFENTIGMVRECGS